MIEGVCVQVIRGDVQAAIEEAGKLYRRRFDRIPTHISLPADVDSSAVKLYGLAQGPATRAGKTVTRHQGTVIVGRLAGDRPAMLQLVMRLEG